MTPMIGTTFKEDGDRNRPLVRDFALLKVLRACELIVTTDVMKVYAINTNQGFIEDTICSDEWREQYGYKRNDVAGSMQTKMMKPVMSYLADAWRSRIRDLMCSRPLQWNGMFVTPTLFSTIHGMAPDWSRKNRETALNAIKSIASACEMDKDIAYNLNRFSARKVFMPSSDVQKLDNLRYSIWEDLNFDKLDLNDLKFVKDDICNIARVLLLLSGEDYYATTRCLAWEDRVDSIERCSYGFKKPILSKAMRYASVSPDACIMIDTVKRSYWFMDNKDAIVDVSNNPVLEYFVLEFIEQEQERREELKKAGRALPDISRGPLS